MKHPQHVAIIMDGNGRWANSHGRPRTYGHIQGARVAKRIITAAAERKIPYLTLFAFSTENWQRPVAEVNFLMRLLVHQIEKAKHLLQKNNVRFRTIGDIHRLPSAAQKVVEKTAQETANNSGMVLTFALNYGGRQELVNVMREVATGIGSGEILANNIDEEFISRRLESHFLPDPDLIIRTSGEHRISNFFLWQAAYSEIYLCRKFWPDFNSDDFDLALAEYASRQRRFGRVPDAQPDTVSAAESAMLLSEGP